MPPVQDRNASGPIAASGPAEQGSTERVIPAAAASSRAASPTDVYKRQVQGNGQTELTEAITGLHHGSVTQGSIRLAGQDLTHASPRQALRSGIANIPEDRQVDGLVLSMSIADNLVLDVFNQEPNARFGARDLGRVRRDGERKLKEFDIRAASAQVPVGTLLSLIHI